MIKDFLVMAAVYLDLAQQLGLATGLQVFQGLAPETVLLLHHEAVGMRLAAVSAADAHITANEAWGTSAGTHIRLSGTSLGTLKRTARLGGEEHPVRETEGLKNCYYIKTSPHEWWFIMYKFRIMH